MTESGERSVDAVVTLAGVLTGHGDDYILNNLSAVPWPPRYVRRFEPSKF